MARRKENAQWKARQLGKLHRLYLSDTGNRTEN